MAAEGALDCVRAVNRGKMAGNTLDAKTIWIVSFVPTAQGGKVFARRSSMAGATKSLERTAVEIYSIGGVASRKSTVAIDVGAGARALIPNRLAISAIGKNPCQTGKNHFGAAVGVLTRGGKMSRGQNKRRLDMAGLAIGAGEERAALHHCKMATNTTSGIECSLKQRFRRGPRQIAGRISMATGADLRPFGVMAVDARNAGSSAGVIHSVTASAGDAKFRL